MNYYYKTLLFSLTLFSSYNVQSQFCPPNGFTNTTSLFFYYDTGTIDCEDRPTTVFVDGSVFTLDTCTDVLSIYNLISGVPVADINNFLVDFGVGTCEFTNGDLTSETLSIQSIDDIISDTRVFPNPLIEGDIFYLIFKYNINATVQIYNVNGKLILKDVINNLTRKEINVSNIPNGVYFMKLMTKTSSITRKVSVMR